MTALAQAIERIQEADQALLAQDPTPFPLPAAGLAPLLAGTLTALSAGDWWVPGLRERVGAVLRDVPLSRLQDGFRGARPYKVAPPSAAPALRALHAVGLALADPDGFVAVHLGIGSVADGALAEAFNLAALQEAHVAFLVAVHPLSGAAPVGPQSAATPCALAEAYGIRSVRLDGTDAAAVKAAVQDAREHDGPTVLHLDLAGPT